ncbi:kinase-like protein [Marasmius fiardii PR-910]|nr:kinase-like protein [Marasmius fiardii PR-910]
MLADMVNKNDAEPQIIQTPRRLSDFSSPCSSDDAINGVPDSGEERRSADGRVESMERRRRSNLDGGRSYDGSDRRAESGGGDGDGGFTGSSGVSIRGTKNVGFHVFFPEIPEGDHLIDDFSCTLRKDSNLIQGRLYVSENHVCFYANLYGWVTQISWAIENQQAHYTELARAVSIYIRNQSEFVPEVLGQHAIISGSGSGDSLTITSSSHVTGVTSDETSPEVTSASSSSLHITTVADIRALVPTEAAVATLLALETGRVPPILDLLQAEITTKTLDQGYRRKCEKYLRLLVNKHRVLPPSLFVNKVEMSGAHPIDVGGYSDIYQGTYGNQSVCLKVLRIHVQEDDERINKDLREFHKEALLWTQLSHPNLLPFLGVNTTLFPRRPCLVSPWMANGQITKFLELNPGHDRLKVISDIAAGTSYLHSHNIVHGDIKGANILVDEQGRCYLADFGLAGASMTTTLLSSTINTGGFDEVDGA